MDLRHRSVFHSLVFIHVLAVTALVTVNHAGTSTVSSMTQMQTKLIFWIGEKHSGKTTSVFKLAESIRNEGFAVAGLLAFSIYEDGRLVGFDAFDLQSEKRAPLARCKIRDNEEEKECLALQFIGGLSLGRASLSLETTKSADLIIVDEFGPLELDQRGWRKDVDSLLASSNAVILLVVRQELINAVKQLYKDVPSIELIAGKRDSIDDVATLLKNSRQRD